MSVCIYVQMKIRVYVYMNVCKQEKNVNMYICMYVFMYRCIFVDMYTCRYVHVCVCKYVNM